MPSLGFYPGDLAKAIIGEVLRLSFLHGLDNKTGSVWNYGGHTFHGLRPGYLPTYPYGLSPYFTRRGASPLISKARKMSWPICAS